jgi:hypothetical protein
MGKGDSKYNFTVKIIPSGNKSMEQVQMENIDWIERVIMRSLYLQKSSDFSHADRNNIKVSATGGEKSNARYT